MNQLQLARRYLAQNPASWEMWEAFSVTLLASNEPLLTQTYSLRSLAVRPEGESALFALFQSSFVLKHDALAERARRRLACRAPSDERTFYGLIWGHRRLVDVPEILLYDMALRPQIFIWLMRSYAALGPTLFNATLIDRYYHDRLAPSRVAAICQFLGKQYNGEVYRPEPTGGQRRYVMEAGLLNHIGELVANNDCLHKMMAMGFLPPGELRYLVTGFRTANEAAMSLWSSTVKLVRSSEVTQADQDASVKIDASVMPFGNRFYFKWQIFCIIQRLWERRGGGSLIGADLRRRLRDKLEELVATLGWSPSDRMVCFHVREPIYDHGKINSITQKYRNTDPVKFEKSLAFLLDAGFKVLRIGTPGGYAYPAHPNYFDYANSSLKTEELDVAIMGTTEFYFGSDSGPSSVAYVFGRPICVVDFVQVALGMGTGNCVYSPRLYRSRSTGRLLSLREMIAQPFRFFRNQTTVEENDIEFVENTADEVLLVLQEFLGRVEKRSFLDEGTYGDRQRRARQVFKRGQIVTNGLVCEKFLEKYSFLLPA